MKYIRCLFLRLLYAKQALNLDYAHLLNCKYFERMNIGGVMYYYIGNKLFLKSKNQYKEI